MRWIRIPGVAGVASVLCISALGCAGESDQTNAPLPVAAAALSAAGKDLGSVVVPSDCTAEAHDDLRRGLALLHHMTYEHAEASFLAAAEADPDCALAYWGAAMTYVHPLWPDTISAEKLEAGSDLLAQAREVAHRSSRDDAFIAAISAYYEGAERSERERLESLLEGWAAAHDAQPDDPEAKLFHALSLLANADASDKSYEKQKKGGGMAEEVLVGYPAHPGAHHYTIHAYDFPPLAEKALDVARSYGEVAPENSHALHMTSHIFTRLGLWPESIAYNVRAAAAAQDRLPNGTISLHHLHALDYLIYAHLQEGNNAAAQEVLDRAAALEPPYQDHSATAYAFAGIPVRWALEQHDWATAAAIEARHPADVNWDRYPYLEAIAHFARAMGAAHEGDGEAAAESIAALDRLHQQSADLNIAYDWAIQVEIQKLSAEAWLAYQNGDAEAGLALMKEAADKEATTEKNPVTPGEVLPAAELYGDMLLAAGQHAEAVEAYRVALARSPNRLNSLYGAARAAQASGDAVAATDFYQQLVDIASKSPSSRAEIDEAITYLQEEAG